jgi:hypothetical protein
MLQHKVLETGFRLHLKVKPTQLGPIDKVRFTWRRSQNRVTET